LLNLLPRLFDRTKRGVWFHVWPIDHTFGGICLLGYESGLGGFVATALWSWFLACDVCDDVTKTTKSRSVPQKLSLSSMQH
jgi:sugar phosphate permease